MSLGVLKQDELKAILSKLSIQNSKEDQNTFLGFHQFSSSHIETN
jgi:hypothetical protein